MRLEGRVYDFGDETIGNHLRAIAEELQEQAAINGETLSGETGPLNDLAVLLNKLASEADHLGRGLAC